MNGLDIFITTYLYDIILLAAAVTGLIGFSKLQLPFKILTLSILSTLILVIAENIFIYRYKYNAPLHHIEAMSGYCFTAIIYYLLFTNRVVKYIILISAIITVPLGIVNAVFFQPFNSVFPTHINLPALGMMVIMSLLLFRQMLLAPTDMPLFRQGVFWFNTAILFYSTTKFLNIGLSNAYVSNPTLDYIVFYLWYFTDYIFVILQGFALFTAIKNNRSHDI